MATGHEISEYFATKAALTLSHTATDNFEIQNALGSKRRMLLSWKVLNK